MADQRIDLGKCVLTLDGYNIIELHICPGETLQVEDIHKIFDHIHRDMPSGKKLMVTAGDKATLSPEARELVSSKEITDQIVADAIVTEHYSHQMSSNFFVRYNHPSRPTKLFKHRDEAIAWLREVGE